MPDPTTYTIEYNLKHFNIYNHEIVPSMPLKSIIAYNTEKSSNVLGFSIINNFTKDPIGLEYYFTITKLYNSKSILIYNNTNLDAITKEFIVCNCPNDIYSSNIRIITNISKDIGEIEYYLTITKLYNSKSILIYNNNGDLTTSLQGFIIHNCPVDDYTSNYYFTITKLYNVKSIFVYTNTQVTCQIEDRIIHDCLKSNYTTEYYFTITKRYDSKFAIAQNNIQDIPTHGFIIYNCSKLGYSIKHFVHRDYIINNLDITSKLVANILIPNIILHPVMSQNIINDIYSVKHYILHDYSIEYLDALYYFFTITKHYNTKSVIVATKRKSNFNSHFNQIVLTYIYNGDPFPNIEYILDYPITQYGIHNTYYLNYWLLPQPKEDIYTLIQEPIYDLELQTTNLYRYINVLKLFDLFINIYYNETFLISQPNFENQIIPYTMCIQLENIYNNGYQIFIDSQNLQLLNQQNVYDIYTLYTPKKEYRREWNLEYFQKLDKYIHPQNIEQDSITKSLDIKLLDDAYRSVIFRDKELDVLKVDRIFNPLIGVNIDTLTTRNLLSRINCNLFINFELLQQNIVIEYKLETYLNRKRFNNIDDYDSKLLYIDGKFITFQNYISPYYNIFDALTFNSELEDTTQYLLSEQQDISPLTKVLQNTSIETYYYRNIVDSIYKSQFVIDGGVFDTLSSLNIYRKDQHIRFFYIFHKFNSQGYLDFIVICEYTIENYFMGYMAQLYRIDSELNDLYIKILNYNYMRNKEEFFSDIKNEKIANIKIEDLRDLSKLTIINDDILVVNLGIDKIQLRHYDGIYIRNFQGEILSHGNSIYQNLVLSTNVWSKSQLSQYNKSTIFARDIVKEKDALSQYMYESFYSWVQEEISE